MRSFIVLLFIINLITAQEAIHNVGIAQIHDNAAVGFHSDFINDGIFDVNRGLAGFYSDNSLTVSGAFKPVFNDLEIMVADGLYLNVAMGITNNGNFILGDVVTPRVLQDIGLEFIDDAFASGEADLTKVNGYARASNKQNFVFPVGDGEKLRVLEFSTESGNTISKSAYFREDPNNPTSFLTSFDTENRVEMLKAVSSHEFWDFDCAVPSTVRLGWDGDSNLNGLLSNIEDLRVVGWHSENGTWQDLGASEINGDLNSGTILSEGFVPDDYSILTFGAGLGLDTNNITLDNYYMSANGDGHNDVLFIDAIALSPRNRLEIFNRWGRLVYKAENYQQQFAGVANVKHTIKKNSKLPNGVYFYIVALYDLDITHQGYLYLDY